MTNAFEQYAEEKGHRDLPKHAQKIAKGSSALDEKMAEKQRLQRGYRIWKREQAKALLTQEPRLRAFRRYLKTVGPQQADELIEAIEQSWLPSSCADIRLFALRLVAIRCDRINLLMGSEPLDDPLWEEPPSVFFRAKGVLSHGRYI